MSKNNTEPESTNSGHGIPYLAICSGILMLFIKLQFESDKPTVGKEVVSTSKEVLASFQTISDADTNSFVGLSTGELRQRLGKPDSVSFPRTLGDTADLPEECWSYYRKVSHEASGTKLRMDCNVEAGKCVSVKVR